MDSSPEDGGEKITFLLHDTDGQMTVTESQDQ